MITKFVPVRSRVTWKCPKKNFLFLDLKYMAQNQNLVLGANVTFSVGKAGMDREPAKDGLVPRT